MKILTNIVFTLKFNISEITETIFQSKLSLALISSDSRFGENIIKGENSKDTAVKVCPCKFCKISQVIKLTQIQLYL